MERVKSQVIKANKSSLYRKLVLSLFERMTKGRVSITMPDGERIVVGDGQGLSADIHIHDESFFRRCVLFGDIGFGESYCHGEWTTSDLTVFVRWAIQNMETSGVISGSKVKDMTVNLLGQVNKLGHFFNRNTKDGSADNISFHYDLSNEFYKLMLDETMSYSCGIFDKGSDDLHKAQLNKLDQVCEDLNLKSSDHILEIGCGWGGLGIHAVKKFDCHWTGITISKEQLKYAQERVREEGLEDKISFIMQDYRELQGEFDKIVSIEMIEAVGHEFLPQYFQSIDRLLKDDGVAVIQAITSPDARYNSFRKGVDFIQKHIFPGSLLPSVGAMVQACQDKTQLHIHNLRDIGLHYADTLRVWREKVQAQKQKVFELGKDDVFYRKWMYYLCYCEAAFIERNISDIQVTFIKPNNTTYKDYAR